MYGYYYDLNYSYLFLMLPAIAIALFAQIKVKSTFLLYSETKSSRGLTGAQAALQILSRNDIHDVRIERVGGKLTDHFDPAAKIIRLSDDVYDSTSVSAIGVACHEAGHAVQHAVDYAPIRFREMLVPVTNFGSKLAFPFVFIGLLLPTKWDFIVLIGIVLYSLAVLFELVTLPVEIDASRRAIKALDQTEILNKEELRCAKKVLSAAALTYLAATLTALLSLLRLVLIFTGRRGRN